DPAGDRRSADFPFMAVASSEYEPVGRGADQHCIQRKSRQTDLTLGGIAACSLRLNSANPWSSAALGTLDALTKCQILPLSWQRCHASMAMKIMTIRGGHA